ncbi:hypothetical protein ACV8DN_003519 [Morganella morganii]
MTLDEWLYELNKIAVENGFESAMDKEEWRLPTRLDYPQLKHGIAIAGIFTDEGCGE